MSPSDTINELLERARRHGGAKVIARAIAIQHDPLSTPSQVRGAAYWEAAMRERHGDPKPAWLSREVVRQTAANAALRELMQPFRTEAALYGVDPDTSRPGQFFTYAEELAIGHLVEATSRGAPCIGGSDEP